MNETHWISVKYKQGKFFHVVLLLSWVVAQKKVKSVKHNASVSYDRPQGENKLHALFDIFSNPLKE
jgi:hypothetical protein